MVTASGLSDEILGAGEGIFAFKRGACRGGSHSPRIWLAVSDPLFSLQLRADLITEGAVEVTGAGLRRPSPGPPFFFAPERSMLPGLSFVGDGLWFSTTNRGTELRIAVCDLFFSFISGLFNVSKTCVMGAAWFTDR